MKLKNQVIFEVASFLLQYPDDNWQKEKNLYEKKVLTMEDEQIKNVFLDFFSYINHLDSKTLEENYVRDFDFSKNTTLYLTNYDCNEACQQSRELINYRNFFAKNGFDLKEELPDYLPALLELCSVLNKKEAYEILSYSKNRLELMHQKLADSQNAYVFVIDTILAILDRWEQ